MMMMTSIGVGMKTINSIDLTPSGLSWNDISTGLSNATTNAPTVGGIDAPITLGVYMSGLTYYGGFADEVMIDVNINGSYYARFQSGDGFIGSFVASLNDTISFTCYMIRTSGYSGEYSLDIKNETTGGTSIDMIFCQFAA
jgi:hypothetical protein